MSATLSYHTVARVLGALSKRSWANLYRAPDRIRVEFDTGYGVVVNMAIEAHGAAPVGACSAYIEQFAALLQAVDEPSADWFELTPDLRVGGPGGSVCIRMMEPRRADAIEWGTVSDDAPTDPASQWRHALSVANAARLTDDYQPIGQSSDATDALRGILIGSARETALFVGCDGRRVHTARTPRPLPNGLLNAGAARALVDVFAALDDAPVSVHAAPHGVVWMGAGIGIHVTLSPVDRYPDWRRSVPPLDAPALVWNGERVHLLDAIETIIAMLETEPGREHEAKLTLGENYSDRLLIDAAAPVGPTILRVVPGSTGGKGDERNVWINLDYLREAVDAMRPGRITVRLREPRTPVVVSDGSAAAFIMPRKPHT